MHPADLPQSAAHDRIIDHGWHLRSLQVRTVNCVQASPRKQVAAPDLVAAQGLAAQAFQAADVVEDAILRTPVKRSSYLSQAAGCEVWLKLDNEQVKVLHLQACSEFTCWQQDVPVQVTGSFKARGASNKASSACAAAAQRAAGKLTAPSGMQVLQLSQDAVKHGLTPRLKWQSCTGLRPCVLNPGSIEVQSVP